MYATIRKYPGCKDAKAVNRIAMAELLPVLRTVKGFRSYVIVDTGNDTIASIGMFDSKESAENANLQARTVVQRTAMKDLLPNPPEITVGEVLGEVGEIELQAAATAFSRPDALSFRKPRIPSAV